MLLQTSRTIIRCFEERDLLDLNEYCSQAEVSTMAGWKPHSSLEISKEVLHKNLKNSNIFAIELKEENKVIGHIAINNDSDNGRADTKELGFALNTYYHRKGIMSEVVTHILQYLFSKDINYVYACCFTHNLPSKGLIEKCGFTFEKEGSFYSKSLKKTFKSYEYVYTKAALETFEIKNIIKKLQALYTGRHISNIDAYVKDFFVNSSNTSILGTSTDELSLGINEVKAFLKDDLEYFGDVTLDFQNIHISFSDNIAWFATKGTVKYCFEHTDERYDNYVEFIKDKANELKISAKQKISFINWILSLTYHQRDYGERIYLWPISLTGELLKEKNSWKFTSLHFSFSKAYFPDERLEKTSKFPINYKEQNKLAIGKPPAFIPSSIVSLLKALEQNLIGNKNISESLLRSYFISEKSPFVLDSKLNLYNGFHEIINFFKLTSGSKLSLDLSPAVFSRVGKFTHITIYGTLKKLINEDTVFENALKDLNNALDSNASSKEKLFNAHRLASYALDEVSSGDVYTWPIRLSTLIITENCSSYFQYLHFSFPFCWILEGKFN